MTGAQRSESSGANTLLLDADPNLLWLVQELNFYFMLLLYPLSSAVFVSGTKLLLDAAPVDMLICCGWFRNLDLDRKSVCEQGIEGVGRRQGAF